MSCGAIKSKQSRASDIFLTPSSLFLSSLKTVSIKQCLLGICCCDAHKVAANAGREEPDPEILKLHGGGDDFLLLDHQTTLAKSSSSKVFELIKGERKSGNTNEG